MNIRLFSNISEILELTKDKIAALARLNIYRPIDLILYKPLLYRNIRLNPEIGYLQHGEYVMLDLEVKMVQYPQKKTSPTRISAVNKSGRIELVFFNFRGFLQKLFQVGNKITIAGKVEFYEYQPQISHPEVIFDKAFIAEQEPIYSLTYGITNSQLRSYIQKLLKLIGNEEWHNKEFLAANHMPSFKDAISIMHGIQIAGYSAQDAYRRLKYDEALANQISFKIIRDQSSKNKGRVFHKNHELHNLILSELKFDLTPDQVKVLEEIESDQKSPSQMLRMIQGDVGCGKTIVAILAAINVIEAGGQIALLAPTEVLATQHYSTISLLLQDKGINVALLTSKIKQKDKNQILSGIEQGEYRFIIGTHSLIQEKVKFKDLAFVIVDEQHKFGVNQRKELVAKGSHPDVLLMSATPIPRSLSLAMFGDLSMSKIMHKPKNRKDIMTLVMKIDKMDNVMNFVKQILNNNQKIYWICPLISQEESDQVDYADTEMRYNLLQYRFGGIVGQLNGKMNQAQKNSAIEQFRSGETKILVSTTVVEVGVDVPDATLIIIENAEKFGLAGLHQLRGRVGRSHLESYCILLYGKKTSHTAMERLRIMKETNDGFLIAEKDLVLRGEGEIFGSKQSGEQNFIFLDLASDIKIIEECNNIAYHAILKDEMVFLANIFNNLNSSEKIIL